MKSQAVSFVLGCCVTVALVCSFGAAPNDSYARASQGIQGELAAAHFLSNKTDAKSMERREAIVKRSMYWLEIMEQFKP